ncbi:unnamed protein product [Amoebophrya sp. A120]|nr:unnamed protein product [Amoebophrya sp. A120]|eukprot:GSA120T00011285001.1
MSWLVWLLFRFRKTEFTVPTSKMISETSDRPPRSCGSDEKQKAKGEKRKNYVYLLHYKPRLVLTSRPPQTNVAETERFLPSTSKYFSRIRSRGAAPGTTEAPPRSFGQMRIIPDPELGNNTNGCQEELQTVESENKSSFVPFISELLTQALAERGSTSQGKRTGTTTDEAASCREDSTAKEFPSSWSTERTYEGPVKNITISPVGRLDLDSEGLIFLTDDGRFSHKVTSPDVGHTKVYRVLAKSLRPLDDEVSAENVEERNTYHEHRNTLGYSTASRKDKDRGGKTQEKTQKKRRTATFLAHKLTTMDDRISVIDSRSVPANRFQRRFGNDKDVRCKNKRGSCRAVVADEVEDDAASSTSLPDTAKNAEAGDSASGKKRSHSERSRYEVVPDKSADEAPTRRAVQKAKRTSSVANLHVVLVEVTLQSGKKHEVRRLLKACGYQTLTLQRVSLGGVVQKVAQELDSVETALLWYQKDTLGTCTRAHVVDHGDDDERRVSSTRDDLRKLEEEVHLGENSTSLYTAAHFSSWWVPGDDPLTPMQPGQFRLLSEKEVSSIMNLHERPRKDKAVAGIGLAGA